MFGSGIAGFRRENEKKYAPQENPEIMIYVVIDEPNAPDQSATSSLISQLASDIMAEAFPYLNITKAPAE